MATFKTYYETGSARRGTIKFHHTEHRTKKAAVDKACALSKRTKGFVTVMRNGIEVASCLRGKRA
jgi:hypothetical protein